MKQAEIASRLQQEVFAQAHKSNAVWASSSISAVQLHNIV